MARRKVTTTVYLESEQDRLLKALSERTGVTVAAYIREGVDRVLEAHADHLPHQLRLFDASQLDLFSHPSS
ncbi:MAG: ribbon-helix-helix domain-containing protein [Myxococcota bacterium]